MKTVKLYGDLNSSPIESKKNITIELLRDLSSPYDKPSPLDFDTFLPWVCLEWQLPVTVTVTRLIRDDFVTSAKRRSSSKSAKSVKSKNDETKSVVTKVSTPELISLKGSVPIKTYYNIRGELLEISIDRCPIDIHKKNIQAFRLCLSFHSLLYKLSIRNGGITSIILHEIGKLLPHSDLTNICLDGANVPEGNYHVLLEQPSQLKTLSLNRCGINDIVCEQLAANIDFGKASYSLLTLELASNEITDKGAQAFGDVFRRNRYLLHLNLSGNRITDRGALSILNHLVEFPLTHDEILELRQRKIKYVKQRIVAYEQCLEDVVNKRKTMSANRRKTSCTKKVRRPKKNQSAVILEERSHAIAESMAKDIVGEFEDPFNSDHVFKRDGYYYCIGNMYLCSLTLAYNNLEYQSMKKIKEVVSYQEQLTKPLGTTGLLRIAIDGNHIPEYCEDYVEIEIILNKVIYNRIPAVWSPISNKARKSK